MLNYAYIDEIIVNALKEDIPFSDISTENLIDENSRSVVDLICKEDGIIAGIDIFKRVFTIIGDIEVISFISDGNAVKSGEKIAEIRGNTRKILMGERTALNLLQRMSGVATITKKFVNKVSHTKAVIVDTRKTTPGLRILEKYAVTRAGGMNHRFNLSDGIMLKDNHIDAAGGIKNAVKKIRENSSFVRKIEVETENIDMVKEALDSNVDIIMLDNMDINTAKSAVKLIGNKAIIEFSGNVSLVNVKEIAEIGVDYISIGALTHSAKILDLSMKNLRSIN